MYGKVVKIFIRSEASCAREADGNRVEMRMETAPRMLEERVRKMSSIPP